MPRGRALPDPLAPVNARRWLVVRNRFSQPVAARAIAALAELRAELQSERERREREGWITEPTPAAGAFFFCSRNGERECVGIECHAPGALRLR